MYNDRDTPKGRSPEEPPPKKKPWPRPPHLDTDEKLHAFIQTNHEIWCQKLREGYVIPEHLNTDEKCWAFLIQNHRNYIDKVNRVCHTNWWQSIMRSFDPDPVPVPVVPMFTYYCNEAAKNLKRHLNNEKDNEKDNETDNEKDNETDNEKDNEKDNENDNEDLDFSSDEDRLIINKSSEESHEVTEENDNQQTEFASIGMLEEEKSVDDSTKGDEQQEVSDEIIVTSDTIGTLKWNKLYANTKLKTIDMISEEQNSFWEHLLGQEGCSYAMDRCGGCVQCDKIWVQPMTPLGLPLNMTDRATWRKFFGSASRPGEIMNTLRRAGNKERFRTEEDFQPITEICYWENTMVQSFLTFIVHELHPTNVYVLYFEEDTTLWDEGHPIKPSEWCTELQDLVEEYTFLIVVMLMQGQSKHFCMYIFDLQYGTVRVCDPDEDATPEDHKNVSFELILLYAYPKI